MSTQQTYDFENMIAHQAQNNPKMRLMYEMLQKHKEKAGKKETNSKTQGQIKKLVYLNRKLARKVSELKAHQKKILKYLNFFIDVNTVLSSAVGACECWGEDSGCPHCHGNGKPGYFEVDEQAFRQYVMPCMERVDEDAITSQKEASPILSRIQNN